MPASGVEAYLGLQDQSPEELVREYATLVKRIAHHLCARLPDSVQPDDLIQSGMIGLLEAASKYDASKGASFETYAGIRVRGAMLDEVRRGDWVPRSVHRNTREISEVMRQLEHSLGRDASDREVADAMGISMTEYSSHLKDANSTRLFSLEDALVGEQLTESDTPNPLDHLSVEHFQRQLADEITKLPEREQLVLSLYYDEELNLKEIGEVLGVSESRVSQIHSQAALRLRSRLSDWLD